ASVNLVKIFPNPAKEKLTILFSSLQSYSLLYTITDVTGKVCMENKQVVSRGSHVITANLSGIPAGVYFVRLNFGDDILVRKINIQ
ncbi:MAG: T9SS type A sorting domain-containing protein, partial [Sphingobacteriales bacterium]